MVVGIKKNHVKYVEATEAEYGTVDSERRDMCVRVCVYLCLLCCWRSVLRPHPVPPVFGQPSPIFPGFSPVLCVPALPGVSSGMQALPPPLPRHLLCGPAAQWGQPTHLRGSWHA